jgi:pSer/pThr/pTyr-binding forkhead associated (FHA) protein
LSGARAGHQQRLAAEFAVLGRHPSSDLPFDAERDLEVSARHAAVFRQGGGYVIRDLGSTNGTWVNGQRVRSDAALEPGDRIQLGTRGPELEFTVMEVEERRPESGGAEEPVPSETPAAGPKPVTVAGPGSTDFRIRVEVARQTDRLRRRLALGIILSLTVIGTVAAWVTWTTTKQREALDRERQRLLTQVDSVQSLLSLAADRASGLRRALDSAQRDAFQLRETIAGQKPSAAALAQFDSQVAGAISRNAPLLRAARFDAAAVTAANGPAIVMVFARFADGRQVGATGFVARVAGDTAWIVTTRHSVTSPQGGPPDSLGVVLNRGRLARRARLAAVHDSADLALLRVIAGPLPKVRAISADSTLAAGDPVALIGFPLGLDLPMGGDWRQVGLTASTSTGTLSRLLPDRLQIDGCGATGASGSPVFNDAGAVIGVLYGGERESGGRIVYAVPGGRVVELLAKLDR